MVMRLIGELQKKNIIDEKSTNKIFGEPTVIKIDKGLNQGNQE